MHYAWHDWICFGISAMLCQTSLVSWYCCCCWLRSKKVVGSQTAGRVSSLSVVAAFLCVNLWEVCITLRGTAVKIVKALWACSFICVIIPADVTTVPTSQVVLRSIAPPTGEI